MRKTIITKIIVLTIVFLMLFTTPFEILNIKFNQNFNAFANTTFIQDLESQLFVESIIPVLIAAGLVFKSDYDWEVDNGSWIHEHLVKESLKEFFENLGENYKPPNDPDGPNLGEVIKNMLRAGTLVSVGYGLSKNIVEIPQMVWELIKSFVDDNYDEGENIIGEPFQTQGYINGYAYEWEFRGQGTSLSSVWIKINNGQFKRLFYGSGNSNNEIYIEYFKITDITSSPNNQAKVTFDKRTYFHNINDPSADWYSPSKTGVSSTNSLVDIGTTIYPENPYPEYNPVKIIGKEGIVDNPNYDWNNNYTDTKVIPIPVEMDPYGNPKTDENGYYLPSTDVDEWLDVQPTEIPNLDPTGTPIPDIPPFPDIENPDDDEKTGILIYIGNILQLIVGQLSKIAEGVKTIVANTNQLVFNTPNPVFDPTTGQQIDPETGQPVEPEPEASTGDGIIGDGIDTNIPTDFEWGNFRHFLDIFFIFIYFIVILILILLKFLQIVFTGLPGIAPNTDLFTAYPEILAGVDYVKNLKVGGLTITVHQAFEFVFLIFFYIFIIKQIRKLYNAMVFEESAIPINHTKDMKLDYYDGNGKINQYGYIPYQIAAPNQNLLPYVEEKQKGNLNYAAKHPSEY